MRLFTVLALASLLVRCSHDAREGAATMSAKDLGDAADIGYLTVKEPTPLWWWYPSPEKPQPVGQCLLPAGRWGVNFKSWRADGYYLIRFTKIVPGCEGHQSGFVKASDPIQIADDLFVPPTAKETLEKLPEHEEGVKSRLLPFYEKEENYQKVKNSVINWFGSTINGCVLFATTSLRMTGTNIPVTKQLGGDMVTLTTKPFVRHMLENLNWEKIEDLQTLNPGDIGVTIDHRDYPTYPSHVFVFMGWKDKENGIAYVNDNQGFHKERAIYGGVHDDRTAYAVRPPR